MSTKTASEESADLAPAVFRADELGSAPNVCSPRLFTKPILLSSLILASACVAYLAFFIPHFSVLNRTAERAANRICTGIGQVRKLDLEDGSKLELTTQTCVEMRLSPTSREVLLLQGEALFSVRHDRAKPFTVFTRHFAIDDLGTQFRVYQHDGATDVGVLAGEIAIRTLSRSHAANRPQVRLGPGEGVTVTATPTILVIRPEKLPDGALDRALAWRQGAVEFHNNSLKQAVSELNRYNVRQLVIVDPAIENLSVGGRFQYSHFDEAAQALARVLGIRVSVDPSNPNILKLTGPHNRLGKDQMPPKPASRRTMQPDQ